VSGALGLLVAPHIGATIDELEGQGVPLLSFAWRPQVVVLALVALFASGCTYITRASVDTARGDANADSFLQSISADGRYVAFTSEASDLVGGDGNSSPDIFVAAVSRPTVDSVTPCEIARGSTATLTVIGTGFLPGARATASAFGTGGVTVASVNAVSETELELSLSVDSTAPTGPRTIVVWNPGTGPGPLATGFGACFGCLTVTRPATTSVKVRVPSTPCH
jgi:hypothetical protein